MVSRFALMFIVHVILAGIVLARWPGMARINNWWKPALYLLCFYLFWGIILSLFPSLTIPQQ